MAATIGSQGFIESDWDIKEHDWGGKCFFFLPYSSLLAKITGHGKKVEQIRFEVRKNGYKTLNNMILFEHSTFKGKVMVEIEKQDKYDDQVITFDEGSIVDTLVHIGSISSVGKVITRLTERVSNKRAKPPRSIYYWLVSGVGSDKTVVFAIS